MNLFTRIFKSQVKLKFLLILVTAIIFLPSIFIKYFGDEVAFIERNSVSNFQQLLLLFDKKDYDGDYYRPVPNFIAGCTELIFGTPEYGYRIFNILIHIFNTLLVFILFSRLKLFDDDVNKFPFLAALLFAVFPINDLAIIWQTDLFDRIMTLFFLLSLICFMKEYKVNIASLLFFLFSVLSKEMAFSLPFVISILSFLKNKNEKLTAVKNALPYLAIIIFVFLLRIVLFDNNLLISNDVHGNYSIFSAIKNLFFFFGLLVFPFFSYTIKTFVENNFLLVGILGAGLAFSYLMLIYKLKQQRIIIILLSTIILFTILPASRLVMKWYLYLPSVFYCGLIAYLINLILDKKIYTKLLVQIVVIGLFSISILQTQFNWVKITNEADKILTEFVHINHDELFNQENLTFLTVPAKIANYPVLHLNFEPHLNRYLSKKKNIEVLSRSNLSSFNDKIIAVQEDSQIYLEHTSVNYFILFGFEKIYDIDHEKIINNRLKKLKFPISDLSNSPAYYFSNGQFIKVNP